MGLLDSLLQEFRQHKAIKTKTQHGMAPKKKDKEIANLRSVVEQLRKEKSVERIPVSETIADLLAYVTENTKEEHLLREHKNFKGLVEQGQNPWKETSLVCFIY